MSSQQTVNFTNPSVITALQSSVGTTPNQVVTQQLSLTGSLYNSTNLFVDKYTYAKGLGPYQVDCIPLQVYQNFAMPKFSANNSGSSGGAFALTGGSNNISFTVQQFDTFMPHDMVVYAPSVRTSMQTTPVFKQTVVGEQDGQGNFFTTLEDYRGQYGYAGALATYGGYLGTTGALATDIVNFFTICNSGTTSSGARQAALSTLRSSSEYTFLKENLKYPFKVFEHIKLPSSDGFQVDTLNTLNGNPLTFTNASGTAGPASTITATTYSATGNLLPVTQNVNAIGGKMGLLLVNIGDTQNIWFDCWSHQAASLGYVVVYCPEHGLVPNYCKYGSKKTLSQLCADKTIEWQNSTTATNNFTGYAMNPNRLYLQADGLGAGTSGFSRSSFRTSSNTVPSRIVHEQYFYTIKCALNKIGIGQYIDYNNVVHWGYSAGGYTLAAAQYCQPTGIATEYIVDGAKPFLFKTKAMLNNQCVFFDWSVKFASASSSAQYNNRLAMCPSLFPLKTPMITITGDGDIGNVWNADYDDMRFNQCAQSIYQYTKMNPDTTNIDTILAKSAVFYKPCIGHTDALSDGAYRPNDGLYNAMMPNGFCTDLLKGWYIPLNPQFPSFESVYQSGLVNEIAYSQLNDLRHITINECMAHRFLGNDYPVPAAAMKSFGFRCDYQPTTCDIYTNYEYVRVGPEARITYDDNYNLTLSSFNFDSTAPAANRISFIATGSTGSFQNLFATNNVSSSSINCTNSSIGNLSVSTNVAITNTITATPGSIVANTPVGQAIFAAGTGALAITNSLVTANSIVLATLASDDATLTSVKALVTPTTITLKGNANATANTKVNWMVIN